MEDHFAKVTVLSRPVCDPLGNKQDQTPSFVNRLANHKLNKYFKRCTACGMIPKKGMKKLLRSSSKYIYLFVLPRLILFKEYQEILAHPFQFITCTIRFILNANMTFQKLYILAKPTHTRTYTCHPCQNVQKAATWEPHKAVPRGGTPQPKYISVQPVD